MGSVRVKGRWRKKQCVSVCQCATVEVLYVGNNRGGRLDRLCKLASPIQFVILCVISTWWFPSIKTPAKLNSKVAARLSLFLSFSLAVCKI